MEKKKILFFIYQMGAGGAARTLLNIMNNLDRDHFVPILVTLNYDGSYEKNVADDIKFIKLPVKRLRSGILPLAKVIRKEKVDIVFSTIPNYNTIAILANRLSFSKAKNVVREADNLGGNRKANIKLRVYGLMYRMAAQVISLSEGVRDNLIKRYGLKTDEIKVIYNPVDVHHIQRQMTEDTLPVNHEKIFQGDEKVVVTAGRLVEQKDQKTLLDAFCIVTKKMKAKLLILGEGPLENDLREQARQLQISDKVFFIGFQQNPYLYFHHADLFALSSIHEGFSHVIAEALACGTPVVSTNCKSGPSEVLDQGKFGLLSEVGSAENMAKNILSVLSYPEEKRRAVIQAGYDRAEYFRADKIVAQYSDVFLNT